MSKDFELLATSVLNAKIEQDPKKILKTKRRISKFVKVINFYNFVNSGYIYIFFIKFFVSI